LLGDAPVNNRMRFAAASNGTVVTVFARASMTRASRLPGDTTSSRRIPASPMSARSAGDLPAASWLMVGR
jgi:hypothetical protein